MTPLMVHLQDQGILATLNYWLNRSTRQASLKLNNKQQAVDSGKTKTCTVLDRIIIFIIVLSQLMKNNALLRLLNSLFVAFILSVPHAEGLHDWKYSTLTCPK